MATRKARQLRIIGGQWRGRKLEFPDVDAIRPTPDRVRETLFNWLQSSVTGSHCLDLFAGSGALALEALSRGAASVTLVEKDNTAAQRLHEHLHTLGMKQGSDGGYIQGSSSTAKQTGHIVCTDALAYLRRQPDEPFNIVFLDPPFTHDLLLPCIELLEQQAWLVDGAWVYLETDKNAELPDLPSNWSAHRSKTAGQVTSHLINRRPSCDDTP